MSQNVYLAVDLGAGSGRVMVGGIGGSGLSLREAHRFHYEPREVSGHLRWALVDCLPATKMGLRQAPSTAK